MANQETDETRQHGVSVYYDSHAIPIAKGRVARELRRNDVMEYVKHGLSKRDIAARLHVSLQTVYNDVDAIFKEWQQERLAMVDREKEIDLQRAEMLIEANLPTALTGDKDAIHAVAQMMKFRRDVLGYAAPTKVDITAFIVEWAEKEGMDPAEVLDVAYEVIPQLESLSGR